jgi:ribonuclease BN (tRNA processing enzyme)
MELLLLGTGNAFTPHGRLWSGALLDGRLLLDCPASALARLREHDVDPGGIERIVLSHAHFDHIAGLPFLLLEYRFRVPRDGPLAVACHPGTWGAVQRLIDLAYPGTFRPEVLERLLLHHPGPTGSIAGIRFQRMPVHHMSRMPCCGYKLSCNGKTLAYTGDTGPGPELDALLDGVDVALIEVGEREPVGGHCNPDIIRELAGRFGSTRFLLTHVHEDDGALGSLEDLSNVHLLRDRERVEI